MSEYINRDGNSLRDLTLDIICGAEGATIVSYWIPRKAEIQRFVEIAKVVHTEGGKPTVLDVGCGKGFLAYLLAETGEVNVVGVDPEKSLIETSPYSHPNLQLAVGDSKSAVERYNCQDLDIVINSWMPNQLNLTPDIRAIGAKVIVYIKELGGATGISEYDFESNERNNAEKQKPPNLINQENRISYHPGRNYQRVFEWFGPTAEEIRKILTNTGLQGFEDKDYNRIDIQFRKDVPIPELPDIIIQDSKKYPWEPKLEKIKGLLEPVRSCEEFF